MSFSPAAQDVRIRLAAEADLQAINDIYNHYVAHSVCTYQEEPETMSARLDWFVRHGSAHPVTVAVGRDGTVLGWGSLSGFHARSAYRRTVENSVYIRHDCRGRGLGRLMLADLIKRATSLNHHTIIAGIDAEQTASIALHRRLGFVEVARLKEVGFKFGRWLDVIYMQLMLQGPR